MQTTELIERLEQAGVDDTPNQVYRLLQDLGLEAAPEAIQPDDAFDRVVEALTNPETAPTQKNGGNKAKSAAIAKAQAAQQAGKGAMVKATQATTTANLAAARKQGKQLSQAGDRAMVESFLTERARGMTEFASSLVDMGQTIAEIADKAEAEFDAEDNESDFLTVGSGRFSLR
ncbi:MAG TPA: hypothetical protein V6D18_15400 [Thermosynechococcaceae cyanobacterium]